MCVFSPGSPTCNANGLQHMDTKLADIDEEEHKEPKRTVTPSERKKEKTIIINSPQRYSVCVCVCVPERSIQGSVPADK